MSEQILIEIGGPEDGCHPVREAGAEESRAPGATVVTGTREELARWAGAADRYRAAVAAARPPGARGRPGRLLGRGPAGATGAEEAYRPVREEIAARLAEHHDRRERALRAARAERFRAVAERPLWGLLAPAGIGPVRVYRSDAEPPPEADPAAAPLTARELEHALLELRTGRTQVIDWYGPACAVTEADCSTADDRVSFEAWWAAVTLFPWQRHRWLPSLPGSPPGPGGHRVPGEGVSGFGCGGAGCGGGV
ncbi:hypothetical protein ACIA8O_33135 [Kitasatospora sp. NPDC051853]|uniref:hypothetical protein n=1 Tax=Kitasatospora sp. NPDC051853 TaxID=3364058 RepID=UPI003796A9A1